MLKKTKKRQTVKKIEPVNQETIAQDGSILIQTEDGIIGASSKEMLDKLEKVNEKAKELAKTTINVGDTVFESEYPTELIARSTPEANIIETVIVPKEALEATTWDTRPIDALIQAPPLIKYNSTELTIAEIQGMGVIQLHAIIKTLSGTGDYPKCLDLCDIYDRARLHAELIKRLNLVK